MSPVLVVLALIVGAVLVTRVSGVLMRRVVRRVAERSGGSRGGPASSFARSGTRSAHIESADATEQRRRQRIHAAARMLNHLVAVVIWIGVVIAVFHLFDVDAALLLSSAGFIGAGLAIGGQHKVNDYLTGLSVLFEDRYGVGDELLVEVGTGEGRRVVVDHIGLVTTRLRDATSTLHIPNGKLELVRNLSQEASSATVRLRLPADDPDATRAATALRNLAGSEQLTDVVFVGDLAAERAADGTVDVAVRTVKPLDDRSRAVLVERAEHALGVPRRAQS